MNLTYGGFTLSICKFNSFEQRAVFSEDGCDYLYTHVRVDVTCVFNGAATGATATLNQQPVNPPGTATGDPMPVSIWAVRHHMMQPRQFLEIDVGGSSIVQSPFIINGLFADCDANNGPRPISFDVLTFSGTKTAIVRFVIETWVQECQEANVVLSNRWEMTEEVDEFFYSKYHVSGRVVLRPDILIQEGRGPDSVRHLVMHPIPLNCKRTAIRVSASSDGTTLTYSFTDQQQDWTLLPSTGIVKVEGRTYQEMDWSPGGRIFGLNVGSALSSPPTAAVGVQVRVWARWGTARENIVRALAKIIATFGFDTSSRMNARTRISVAFPGRYGEAEYALVFSGVGRGMDAALAVPAFDNLLTQKPYCEIWPDKASDYWVVKDGISPLPSASGTRGDLMLGLLTQELTNPCLPPEPPVKITPVVDEFGE